MGCTVWSGMRGFQLNKMRVVSALVAFFLLLGLTEIEAQKYYGKRIGQLSQLQHLVKGEVYAVDSRTIHIKGFTYDGTAPDAFFYAGKSGNPSDNGIVIPDENGRRDPLGAYSSRDVTITLPDGMTLKDLAWLSIWCKSFAIDFGSLTIPRSFDYPRPQKIDGLPTFNHGVKSDKIVVVDAQTFLIPDFHYDGQAPDAFFWVGTGNKPTSKGVAVPDENGGRLPLKKYSGKTIVITLPDSMTVFDIDHFGVWCKEFAADFGHVIIPRNLNIPPSLKMLGVAPQTKLNCEVLHDDLAFEVRWAVAGDSIVMQLVGRVDDGEYMSFGLSGSDAKSVMVGGDITVAWLDQLSGRGEATDYYLDAKSQCQGGKGSCPDEKVRGGRNNVRLLNAAYINDFTMLTFQRPLRGTDSHDKAITPNREQAVIWAIGPVNSQGDTAYHRLRLRGDMFIDFGRSPFWNCPYPDEQESRPASSNAGRPSANNRTPSSRTPTTRAPSTRTRTSSNRLPAAAAPAPKVEAWHIPPIPCYEPEDGVFYAQIGPTGGKSGYNAITGNVGWGISWYINGLLIPEVNVIRGKTYTFVVEGGSDPNIPAQYHPFYISDDAEGGYEHKTQAERDRVQVFAGIEVDTDGTHYPTAYGRLCEWKADPNSPANTFRSFGAYQRTLNLDCQEGQPGILQWTPDAYTPDQVYYQCYTHRNLGWKMNVVDRCNSGSTAGGGSKVGGSRADYDYYDDETLTNTTDDMVTVGGTRQYDTKVSIRNKDIDRFDTDALYDSGHYEDDVLSSFDSFPFGIDGSDLSYPRSEVSNEISTKTKSKVPLGAPGFEFPDLPPFKKASINATGFKTIGSLTRRMPELYFPATQIESFEYENTKNLSPEKDSSKRNHLLSNFPKEIRKPVYENLDDPFTTLYAHDIPWDSKRTSNFPQFSLAFDSKSETNKHESLFPSRKIQKDPEVKIPNDHFYNDENNYPEMSQYDDFYDEIYNSDYPEISPVNESTDSVLPVYSYSSPTRVTASKSAPQQYPRKPYTDPPVRPPKNQIVTAYNKISHDYRDRDSIAAGQGLSETHRRTTIRPTTSYAYPSVVSAIPERVLNYTTEKEVRPANLDSNIYPEDYWYKNHKINSEENKPAAYLSWQETQKQNIPKFTISKSKENFPSVDKSKPIQIFDYDIEDREIDPKTGLPYAVNEGFDPSTIVFENDFKPVQSNDLGNKVVTFKGFSNNQNVVRNSREPNKVSGFHYDSEGRKPPQKPDVLSKYYAEVLQQPPQTIVVRNADPYANRRNIQAFDKNPFGSHPLRRAALPAFKLRPPPDDYYKRFARRILPSSESESQNKAPAENDKESTPEIKFPVENFELPSNKSTTRKRRSARKMEAYSQRPEAKESPKLDPFLPNSPSFLPQMRGLQNFDRIYTSPFAPRINYGSSETGKYLSRKLFPPPVVQKRILQDSNGYENRNAKFGDKFKQNDNVNDKKLTPTQATHLIILKDIWDNLTDEKIHEW